jgi:glutamate racemase
MASSESAIGIFDSGVGGLTVLKEIRARLPHEDLIYLGDTARLPYGTKSHATVERYAARAAAYLEARDVKLIVVACNTASAVALPLLTEKFAPMPVIGVVEPGARRAVAQSRTRSHLILATEATTRERAYTQAIQALDPDAVCQEVACSMFVALAEEGWGDGAIAEQTAEKYLLPLREGKPGHHPDTAILGCTHFPLVRAAIAAALGESITIVDSATTTAESVVDVLEQASLLTAQTTSGSLSLLATEGPDRFARVGGNFLGAVLNRDDIEVVDIELSS